VNLRAVNYGIYLWWNHQKTKFPAGFEGFEVLTAAAMKTAIFWGITPCYPLKVNRRFGGTFTSIFKVE
jgi:hypothetical protein